MSGGCGTADVAHRDRIKPTVSDLDQQLARANVKAKAERRRERSNGGPVDGGPDDRWIAYHATIRSRSLVVWAFVFSVAVLLCVGIYFANDTDRSTFWILTAASLVPAAVLIVHHVVERAKAIDEQRAYVASLPFELAGYLDTMREPRWWSDSSYTVVYRPVLRVQWAQDVDARVVEKLCTLAGAWLRAEGATGSFRPHGSICGDPWRWARIVIAEVLVPLSERTPVARAELRVVRGVECKGD
jgi:hypothetical protein